jgi:hypothetical protein
MDGFGLFGLLAWLLCLAALGSWVMARPGLAPKLLGALLMLLGLAPSIVVLWMLAIK